MDFSPQNKRHLKFYTVSFCRLSTKCKGTLSTSSSHKIEKIAVTIRKFCRFEIPFPQFS